MVAIRKVLTWIWCLQRVYATYVKDYYLRRYSSIELYDRQHFRNTTPNEISGNMLR